MEIKTDNKVYLNNFKRNVRIFSLYFVICLFVFVLSFIVLYKTMIIPLIAIFIFESLFLTISYHLLFKVPSREKDLVIRIEPKKLIFDNDKLNIHITIEIKDIASIKSYMYKGNTYKLRIYSPNLSAKLISFKKEDLDLLINIIRGEKENA